MILSDKEIINNIKSHRGEKRFVCFTEDCGWESYECFWSKVDKICRKLKGLGVKSIIAVLENGNLLFRLYFACMFSNITIIPIDPNKTETEINTIISEHTTAKVIRSKEDLGDLWEIETEKESIIFDFENAVNTIDLSKEFMITYTSGSTGRSKGVRHNLRNLVNSAWAFSLCTGFDENRIMCHVMPMTYMAGILNTIIMPFVLGAKVIVLPRFSVISAISFWKRASEYKVDTFWLSPAMLSVLMTVDKKSLGKEYLSKIKPLFFIGTAPLYRDIRIRFEKQYEVRLLQSYGLSETLFLSTETPDRDIENDSVGRLLPEVNAKIGYDKEIKISVPWIFLGYSNEKTESYFEGSYYKTGDIGDIKDGSLYLTGRKKDLIIKGGMNISPKAIEDNVILYNGIIECAVSGVVIDDEERIVCWYVASEEINETELNINIERKLGKIYKVDCFRHVNEIPKNLNGKVDKGALREAFSL